ncbi:MAG TPA: PAS domain S-box protein [Clostridia bacterium]|nr:PAS domain S-box protein [Clostridia bacterium]
MDKNEACLKPVPPAPPAPTFESVLLELCDAVAEGLDAQSLVDHFCSLTRRCFGLDGVYCWRAEGETLVGYAADGLYEDEFRGARLTEPNTSAAQQAIANRRAVLVNEVRMEDPPEIRRRFPARSMLAIPIIVAGNATGAVVLTSATHANFFSPDVTTRASILVSQLGALIETARLTRTSLEDRHRAEAMIESAGALHTRLDLDSARNGLTRRVLDSLRAELVALLECSDETCRVASVAVREQKAESALVSDAAAICRFGERLAAVLNRDYPLIVDLAADPVGLPMVTSGQALVVPLRAATAAMQLIVYGGPERRFSEADISLARAICGVGALAIQNSQLYATTSAQATELKQLLEIATELGTAGDLERFLKQFVLRAADFLGFKRSFIGLIEQDGVCRIRYSSDNGAIVPLVIEVPNLVVARVLDRREVFWTENARALAEADPVFIEEFKIGQVLTAPLFGSDGKPLGVFGVLDQSQGGGIRPEDIERARALASQVSVVLEATRNLHIAEEHRRRAESLMSLALEVSSSIRLPELVSSITRRALEMARGRIAALALSRGTSLEVVMIQGADIAHDRSIVRRLNAALTEYASRCADPIRTGNAAEVLGGSLAESLAWTDFTVVRLVGTDNDLVGLLCIANRGEALEAVDRTMLQALASHASVALDNSRLFTRIAQSNSQWVEIFDSISDFIVVHDHNNRVLRVNRGMADFIGVRPAELIGVSMRALMAMAQDIGPDPCPFCRSKSDPTDEFVHPVLERMYLVSTSRINSSLEEGIQTIHVLKDITDRREAERRYRELFDNIQEGLFFSSPEGRFIEVNDALVRMLGYDSRDELLQIDITSELYLAPEHRTKFVGRLEENGALRNYEEVLRRKDGSLIHTLQNAFAVRDSQGRIVQYRGLMLDITELKMFQAELQRQRDFNVKILNNTQSLIVVADTAGLISYANRRCYEVGGYAPGELVGRRLSRLVGPAHQEEFESALVQTLAGNQVDNFELPLEMASGRVGQFSANMSPMRDEQGQVTSIVVVMSDITDVAVLQAKLMQTEKMAAVGQLVSGVAHEVNNPLTAILGFADLLSSQDDLSESAQHDLTIIIQEAQRTKQIVQNLLSFARQQPPQREPLQVNDVIRRTLQLRGYDFANHGITVLESFQEPMPELIGDTSQLQQVFLNIVNNAYDAVSENGRDGRIEVATRVVGGSVEITFKDNGSGIKAVDRIFDPFYTTKEVGKGTGLGLSICYGIIREHGGEISATNRTDARGAIFTVRLPAAESRLSAAPGAQ